MLACGESGELAVLGAHGPPSSRQGVTETTENASNDQLSGTCPDNWSLAAWGSGAAGEGPAGGSAAGHGADHVEGLDPGRHPLGQRRVGWVMRQVLFAGE